MYEYNDLEFARNKLKTDLDNGLTNQQIIQRQKYNGRNILEGKKKENIFKVFIRQLKDPMIYILLGSILVSLFLKEFSDAIVIGIVVLINALIGTFQEIKTEKALEVLKKMSTHKCNVLRNGEKVQIDSSELVVGDIVYIESGSSVSADLRIIEANNLNIDESSITGESKPVNKTYNTLDSKVKNLGDKKNMAYMSTLVIKGSGKGVVVATGMNTEIGKIAKLLKEDDNEVTPLQKRLFSLSKILGVLTLAICGVMFLLSLIEKRNPLDMLISSISLAVAAIPEGLPAVVTIVLAIGVQRMIKVNTIVKRLPSVETLGSVSVVCSDKTGTITENKLICDGVYQNGKFVENFVLEDIELIRNLSLCNNAYKKEDKYIGMPMECALLEVLDKNNIERIVEKRLEEIEFDSARKMMSTLNNVVDNKTQYTKGAFDRIITRCKYIRINNKEELLTREMVENLKEKIDIQASKSKRILAFAYKQNVEKIEENQMTFVGFLTFVDPPRKGVKQAVEKFKEAGIKTVMITGDYIKTAYAIGKEIGIVESENQCITGEEIDSIDDKELAEIVEKKSVFARVSPIHKARIVNAYKENDHIVAMTGDGVNDAPSLKKADIGIAMGINGSDVSKEASDMVLADDNFTTIETAIEEGRTIYNNIRKSVLFLLSSNFSEIIVMLVAIILRLPLPLLAIHILVVNLLTDSIPALALGADVKEKDIMKEKPRGIKESLFVNGGLANTIIYGVLIAVLTLIAFFIPVFSEIRTIGVKFDLGNIRNILENNEILLLAQTYAFIVLSLSELFYSLLLRNIRKSVFRKEIFKNKYLNIAIVGGVAITWLMIFIPAIQNILKFAKISYLSFVYLVFLSSSILFLHTLIFPFVSRETNNK